jgi:hypothetical protein
MKMNLELRPGAIVRYPYLWKWQRDRGETEGRKQRPVCVVIVARRSHDETTHLGLLAISSRAPDADQTVLEIPEIECRRGGLSDLRQAWITVSEYNYDIAERSYYLDPRQPILGRFSKPFMMRLAAAFAPLFRQQQARVDRAE